jgi:hypothetical protein
VKKLLTFLWVMVATLPVAALAQNWTLYAPPEADFRVVFPATPTRIVIPSAAGVEYRAEGNGHRYSVFRHNPGQAGSLEQARALSEKRMVGDDQRSRGGQDESDLGPNEFAFRVGRVESLHRVVMESGRYYELVVQVEGEDRLSRQSARDFFNSFHLGAGGVFARFFRNVPAPESCQSRVNLYSRRFCEYATCLVPGQESNPLCVALPGMRR